MNSSPYYSKSNLHEIISVLSRALVILSTDWTNQGFKLKKDGNLKVCIIGAIDVAYRELFNHRALDDSPAVTFVSEVALSHFDMSAVSVNDELGYSSVVKLMALSIEKACNDATRTRS